MTVHQLRFDGTDAPRPASSGRPTTERQVEYMTTLLTELASFDRDVALGMWDYLKGLDAKGELDRYRLSQEIDNVKKVVEFNREQAAKSAPETPEVPAQRVGPSQSDLALVPQGSYAVTADAGHTVFVYVKRYPSGAYLVFQQVSDDQVRMSKIASRATLGKILEQGIKESSVRYGKELGICGVCGRTLTNEASREAGIGPVCASKL